MGALVIEARVVGQVDAHSSLPLENPFIGVHDCWNRGEKKVLKNVLDAGWLEWNSGFSLANSFEVMFDCNL
jgi:hypothetical protein